MKFIYSMLLSICITPFTYSQLLVNNKNLNEEKDVEYVQLSFYYESKQMSPVYTIDYGAFPQDDQRVRPQNISINKEEVTSRMSPAYVLNRLYKAGWEYMGDVVFMKAPLVENSQTYTLRRRKDLK